MFNETYESSKLYNLKSVKIITNILMLIYEISVFE